jgi:hypothetical protein
VPEISALLEKFAQLERDVSALRAGISRLPQLEQVVSNVERVVEQDIPDVKGRVRIAEAQIALIAAYTTKAPTKSYLTWVMAGFSLAGFIWNVFGPSIRQILGLV